MTETVTISALEYRKLLNTIQDLEDAFHVAEASRMIASGEMPTVAESELDELLAAPAPLGFWRKKRGYTQASLAEAAGLSQPYIAQMESGQRTGDVRTIAKLARLLRVRMEDLVACSE